VLTSSSNHIYKQVYVQQNLACEEDGNTSQMEVHSPGNFDYAIPNGNDDGSRWKKPHGRPALSGSAHCAIDAVDARSLEKGARNNATTRTR
jgi:hypothetical protein